MAAMKDDEIIAELRSRLTGRLGWLSSELECLFKEQGGGVNGKSLHIGLNKKYGSGYSACVIHGPLNDAARTAELPSEYRDILGHFNGAKLFAISLFGILDDESNNRRCLSLADANQFWIHEYRRLPKGTFHFGSRRFSYEENIGYFYGTSQQVFSARKTGETVNTWPSIEGMLHDEWEVSKRLETERRDRLSHIRASV
jgi:hypothetical protein